MTVSQVSPIWLSVSNIFALKMTIHSKRAAEINEILTLRIYIFKFQLYWLYIRTLL